MMLAAFCGIFLTLCGTQVPLAMPFKEDPPIMVDGDLSDWDVVVCPLILNEKHQYKTDSIDPKNYNGPQDLSAIVKTAWRDYGFFIMIKVTDNFHNQQFNGKNVWRGDHVELFLDTIPAVKTPEDTQSSGQYHFMLSPGNFKEIKPEIVGFFPANLKLQDTKIEAVKTSDGYIIEAEIPWSNFKIKGVQDKIIGLDIWISDTDEFDHQQSYGVQKTLLTNGVATRKSNKRGYTHYSLTTTDGIVRNIKMEGFKPVKLDIAPTVQPATETTVTFNTADLPDSIHPIFKFQANIPSSRKAGLWGWRGLMRVFVNGKELTGENILFRPLAWRTRDGLDYTLYSRSGFIVPITGAFVEGNDPKTTRIYFAEHFNMHDFALDLTGAVKNGTNTIVIKNIHQKSVLQLRKANIEFAAGELRKPKRPAPTGKLPVIKPANDFKNECTIVSNGNPIKLRNGINNWTINSSFSTPDGKWVTSGSNFFKHSRKVEKVDGGILVSDTFTNLTDEALPIIQKHEIPASDKAEHQLSGLKAFYGDSAKKLMSGSTFTAEPGRGGIGIIPESRILTVHSTALVTKNNAMIFQDDQFVLPPKGSITQQFRIFTVEKGDYWEFINVVRNNLKLNYTLEGAFTIAGPKHFPIMTEKVLKKRVKDYNINAMSVSTYGYTEKDFAKLEDTLAYLRKLFPGVKIMRYYHSQLTNVGKNSPVSENELAKLKNDRVLLRNGKEAFYYNTESGIFFTTLDNEYGKWEEKELDDLLDNWGLDGIYWDEFSSSGVAYHYGEPWDNCSGDIDPVTHKLTAKKSSIYILQYEWKMKIVKKILAKGKFIFSGVPREFLHLVPHGHCETAQLSNAASQMMRSPIQMSDYTRWPTTTWQDYYNAMRDGLDYGVLFCWSNLAIPNKYNIDTYPTLVGQMYPITPIEFRKGCIIGKERIITKNSGRYGWDDNSKHEIHVFDATGREVIPHGMKTLTVNGKTWTDLRLPEDWSAAIVRK